MILRKINEKYSHLELILLQVEHEKACEEEMKMLQQFKKK